MAFPARPSMPPPGAEKKPEVVIGIGAEPKKPAMGAEPDGDEGGDSSKLAGAGVVKAEDHCQNCTNWSEDGSCKELPGQWNEQDACIRYFSEKAEGSPDGDEGMGGEESMMAPPEAMGQPA